jgi:hypothetical protein
VLPTQEKVEQAAAVVAAQLTCLRRLKAKFGENIGYHSL